MIGAPSKDPKEHGQIQRSMERGYGNRWILAVFRVDLCCVLCVVCLLCVVFSKGYERALKRGRERRE